MGITAAVIDRLKAQVPGLGQRVEGAADLARLVAQQTPPQATPAAHVFPAGLSGGAAEPMIGLYRQDVARLTAVLLTVRAQDQAGQRAVADIEALIDAIVEAIAGWAPHETRGVFVLRRAQLVSAVGGAFSYELTFSLSDELRILA